jgi:hypothetical protein
MRTFGKLRVAISSQKDLARTPAELEKKYDGQFQIVFEAIHKLIEVEEKPTRKIGFLERERQAAYRTSVKRRMSTEKTPCV